MLKVVTILKSTGKTIGTTLLSVALASSMFAFVPSVAHADAKSDLDAANEAASNASSLYDEAVAKQEAIASEIADKTTQIDELNQNIPAKQQELSRALVSAYKSDLSPVEIIVSMMSGSSMSDAMAIVDSLTQIANYRYDVLSELNQSKSELAAAVEQLNADKTAQDQAVEEAKAAKQDALDKQEAARAAWNKANASSASIGTTRRAPTSSVAFDEESARAWIVKKESGGNYNARNGKYIGAYQLTNSYLNGDYSPENQDRVAEQYVRNRYGSWMNAVAFWQSHGWY